MLYITLHNEFTLQKKHPFTKLEESTVDFPYLPEKKKTAAIKQLKQRPIKVTLVHYKTIWTKAMQVLKEAFVERVSSKSVQLLLKHLTLPDSPPFGMNKNDAHCHSSVGLQ